MTDTTPDDDEGILTEEDHRTLITALVRGAGPDGIERTELIRQANVAADWLADQKLGAALYRLVTEQKLDLHVDEEGEVHMMTNRKEAGR